MQEHKHLFTLDEAVRLLPVVRQLMAELQDGKSALVERTETFDAMLEKSSGNGHMKEDPGQARQAAEKKAMEMQRLFNELDGLGVELKGIDQGLVDFPSIRDGHVVYLCWRQGEETIAYWHEKDAGFAGRQPI